MRDERARPLIVVAQVLHAPACVDEHIRVCSLHCEDHRTVRALVEQLTLRQERIGVARVRAQVPENQQGLLLHLWHRVDDQPRQQVDTIRAPHILAELGCLFAERGIDQMRKLNQPVQAVVLVRRPYQPDGLVDRKGRLLLFRVVHPCVQLEVEWRAPPGSRKRMSFFQQNLGRGTHSDRDRADRHTRHDKGTIRFPTHLRRQCVWAR